MIFIGLVLILYIFRMKVSQKLNIPAWKSLIPFYGSYFVFKKVWNSYSFWIYAFCAGLIFIQYFFLHYDLYGAILFIVCLCTLFFEWMALHFYLCKWFKMNIFVYLLLIFLYPAGYCILGFSKQKE